MTSSLARIDLPLLKTFSIIASWLGLLLHLLFLIHLVFGLQSGPASSHFCLWIFPSPISRHRQPVLVSDKCFCPIRFRLRLHGPPNQAHDMRSVLMAPKLLWTKWCSNGMQKLKTFGRRKNRRKTETAIFVRKGFFLKNDSTDSEIPIRFPFSGFLRMI